MKRFAVLAALGAIVLLLFGLADPRGFRHPAGLAAQTEEPTKPPYVFPTPIFIPTYPDESPTPTRTPSPTRTSTLIAATTALPTDTPAPEQTYTVQAGDSPWIIAQKVYGDGTKYPLIMAANNLTSTTRLRVGAVLIIPPAPGRITPTAATLPATPTPTLARILTPTLAPTAAASPTPTPTVASSTPASIASMAGIAINLLSAMLAVGALLSAAFAILAYIRAHRLASITAARRRLRFR